MAWGIQFEATFGQFFPEGAFVGWKERRKTYFENGLTPEEEAKINPNNRLNSYLASVSRKFNRDGGPIADHEWPERYETIRVPKKLGSIFQGTDRVLIVEEPLKKAIEALEPDIHLFRQIDVASRGGTPLAGPHYVMVINQFLKSFSPEETDQELFHQTASSLLVIRSARGYKDFDRIALKEEVHTGKHLWREQGLSGPDFFISDALHDAIVEQQLLFPKHARVRDF